MRIDFTIGCLETLKYMNEVKIFYYRNASKKLKYMNEVKIFYYRNASKKLKYMNEEEKILL